MQRPSSSRSARHLPRLAALFALVPFALGPSVAGAQTRIVSPNGRPVLEVRTGVQPNINLLRTLVVTAGPISGSTSLLATSATPAQLFGPGAPPPGFTVIVSDGQLFSLAGGCARGNQLDFPYINGFKLHIARFVGTTHTIVTSTLNNVDQYESVNCVTAPDGLSTMYVLVNRTAQRTEIWRERTNNVFTRERQYSAVARLPFNGGLRPNITLRLRPVLPPRPSAVAAKRADDVDPLQLFDANVFPVVDQTSTGLVRVHDWRPDSNELTPVRNFGPFTVPAGPTAALETVFAGGCLIGDFSGNGQLGTYITVGGKHCPLIDGATVPPDGTTPALLDRTFAFAFFPFDAYATILRRSAYTVEAGGASATTASPYANQYGAFGPYIAMLRNRNAGQRFTGIVAGPGATAADLMFAALNVRDPAVLFADGGEDDVVTRDDMALFLLREANFTY